MDELQLASYIQLLRYITQHSQKNFEYVLVHYDSIDITKSACALLLQDIIMIYDLCSQCVENLVNKIFDFDKEHANLIYKMYEEINILTKLV